MSSKTSADFCRYFRLRTSFLRALVSSFRQASFLFLWADRSQSSRRLLLSIWDAVELVEVSAMRLVKANNEMLKSISHVPPSLPPAHLPLRSAALQSFSADAESLRRMLRAVRAVQNAKDRAHDIADLHQLMRAARAARDDNAIIEVLQIAPSEMPDATRTLECALKYPGNDNGPSLKPGNTGAGHSSAYALDREFMATGLDALRQLSKGTDLDLPSWTITWFELYI
jgi:hypothetical protein